MIASRTLDDCKPLQVTMLKRASAIAAAAIGLCAAMAASADTACDAWNTSEFFQAVDLADVGRCLEAGANPNARDDKGGTPLQLAATYNKNLAIIAALLEAGADVNGSNAGGVTPLHLAAAVNKNPAIAAALLDAGAAANVRDSVGRLPFDYAKTNAAILGSDAYWRLNDAQF